MSEGNGKERGKGKGQGSERKKFSPEERKARRLELAQRDDAEVITRRAAETNDFIRLLSANDYIVNRLRNNLGRRNGVPAVSAVLFLERNERLRQEMNALNAEMCQAMNIPYRPPRGYDIPGKIAMEDAKEVSGKRKEPVEQEPDMTV